MLGDFLVWLWDMRILLRVKIERPRCWLQWIFIRLFHPLTASTASMPLNFKVIIGGIQCSASCLLWKSGHFSFITKCKCMHLFFNIYQKYHHYLVAKAYPTLLQPHELLLCPWDFPGKILEWVAISSPRGSSQPRDQTHVSCTVRQILTTEPPRKPNKRVRYC